MKDVSKTSISHVFHPYLSYFLPPPSPNKLYSTKQLTDNTMRNKKTKGHLS